MDTIESKIENFTAEPYDVRFAQWANAGRFVVFYLLFYHISIYLVFNRKIKILKKFVFNTFDILYYK